MNEVTRILSANNGDPDAAVRILPLVYDELRRLAAEKMASEKPGQTLQGTALVHEAYLRLVDVPNPQHWNSRGHFFAAAAEAMRRILIERARRNAAAKHGGALKRIDLDIATEPTNGHRHPIDLLALDDALRELEQHDAPSATLVKLRFFAGLSHQEAADSMGIGRRAADRAWALAKAWLYQRLGSE